MTTFTISMAFLMGLTGSLHCAGMCGPIIWVMPFQVLNGFSKWLGIALNHIGHITTYAIMGVTLYSFKSLFQPQWQQYISIGLGAVLLLLGLMSFFPTHRWSINLPWSGFVRKYLGKFMSNPNLGSLFATGVLNGLLPCGLVYMALSASLAASTPQNAAVLMYAFGAGTVPMLVALTVLKNKAAFMQRLQFRKLVPAFMLVFGCLFVLRGMNLGIPYLSPKVTMEQNEVKADCCHKE